MLFFSPADLTPCKNDEFVLAALKNVGIFCDNPEEAVKKAIYERFLPDDFDGSLPLTVRTLYQVLFGILDLNDDLPEDDTPLTKGEAELAGTDAVNELTEAVFAKPTNRFRIHPMEHELSGTPEKTDEYLTDTLAGGAVINCVWHDGWNENPENLKNLRHEADLLKERRLHAWIYDENYYPSGWASGYVDTPDDRYIAKNIGVIVKSGEGPADITVELPKNGHGFLGASSFLTKNGELLFDTEEKVPFEEKNVRFLGREGAWTLLAFFIRDCNIWPYHWATEISPPIGPRKHLNFLDHEAVDKFLEGSLEPVVKAFDGEPGKEIEAVFTDEPALQALYIIGPKNRWSFESVPFGNELFEAFLQRHGYDLREKMAYLFFSDSEKARYVRAAYYDTVAYLIGKNFTGNYQEHCHKVNLHFSGHMHGEETLQSHILNYGDYMRCVSFMDYPGFDMLEAEHKRFWDRGPSFCHSGLFASSQSRLNGHNTTMVEVCPVIGPENFLKDAAGNFERLMTDCIFTGATQINTYGYRFINQQAQFHALNTYVGRVNLFGRNAVSDAKIALYYPAEDAQSKLWCGTFAMADLSDAFKKLNTDFDGLIHFLFTNALDFNVINRLGIEKAEVKDGVLSMNGMTYRAVIVPPVDLLPQSVMEKLKEFADNGGHVYFMETLPTLGMNEEETEAVRRMAAEFAPVPLKFGDLAFKAAVKASHTCEQYDAFVVTNGAPESAQASFDGWSSDQLPATLEITMKTPETFNAMKLYTTGGHEQKAYRVEAWVMDSWKMIFETEDNTAVRLDAQFDAVTTDKIRLIFEKGCKTDEKIARLNEISLFNLIHSDQENAFRDELRAFADVPFVLNGAEADSLRISRRKMNGKTVFFVVNASDNDQHLSFSGDEQTAMRLWDPKSGKVSDDREFTLLSGRAVFIEN